MPAMDYKMIVSDLDGTLLNNKSELTPNIKSAIQKFVSSGFKFVIASGRSYRSIGYFIDGLGINVPGNYGIGFNGGMVFEADTLKVIRDVRLANTLAMETVAELKDFQKITSGWEILVYVGDRLFSESANDEAEAYKTRVGVFLEIRPFDTITEDPSKILLKGSSGVLDEVERHMRPFTAGRMNMFRSAGNLLEFCDLDAHKGAGLARLCEITGTDIKGVIAVGDNANDISMIKKAGLGIAVANAEECLKAAADAVYPLSNDQDAVCGIISDYFAV